jgi:YebC/PmpR family DNA-binding regulatory protein
VTYSEVLYEGYGPNGVAIMLQALTDNRNRTAGEVRHRFSKYGGNLGESGCVAWMFERRGVLVVERGENVDEDEVMLQALDAGAEDVVAEGDVIEIHTDPSEFIRIKEELEGHGLTFLGAEISFIPRTRFRSIRNRQRRWRSLSSFWRSWTKYKRYTPTTKCSNY